MKKKDRPGRVKTLPYGRQTVDEDDIAAVVEVLESDWLTTGPKVEAFERAFSERIGVKDAVTVSSGTAALHAAMFALGIGPGDEVIVPPMTFAATANCIVYQGGTPVFADIDPETLLIDPAAVVERLTPSTRAVINVDYAGQPCDYPALLDVCRTRDVALVADACHALGASCDGKPVGALAALSTFSFHPVKHITTGEGGIVATDDPALARRMRRFRNHGISRDHHQRAKEGSSFYEMVDLGFNYRLSDIQCALGLSQLAKLEAWVKRRREIAALYDAVFVGRGFVEPLKVRPGVEHAYHLYVVRLARERLIERKKDILAALHAEGIGANVHYPPVHLHPYYKEHFRTAAGLAPNAEKAYRQVVSLPIFPSMTDSDVERVAAALIRVCEAASGMKIVAIIQARMGSTRLPGKVLADIGGRSMMARVIRRTTRARLLSDVTVATTTQPEDDAIVQECAALGVRCFRGSEQDVLDRYHASAHQFSAEAVVRITSDCPLIDPEVTDRVVSAFLSSNADNASNILERTFPRGLGVEVFSLAALDRAWEEATESHQRAHVTPYMYESPGRFELESIESGQDTSHLRWTVDTSEDLEVVRALYARLGNDDGFSWLDALRIVELEPDFLTASREVIQKRVEEC